MSLWQYARIVWARRWLFLMLFLAIAVAGSAFTLMQPKRYVAEVSMLVDFKPDPILGAMAPGLVQPGFMATQAEMLTSENVAIRAVKKLGLDEQDEAIKKWQEATQGKTPLENFLGAQLIRGVVVEPSRGSNFINLTYTAQDPKMAAAAANAIAQSYLDMSVDLRVQPAKQYAAWFDEQSKTLRADLEAAQKKLSDYQQKKGITDERLDQETARLNVLVTQLATAQAGVGGATLSGEMLSDPQAAASVQALKLQLSTAQARLSEISNIVGTSHPQRIALESQVADLRRQVNAEIGRVSGGAAALRGANQRRIAELQQLVDAQKARVLNMRGSRDDMSVLVKDVENAQRAYESARQRLSQLSLESQSNQANVQIMSPAVEPAAASLKQLFKGIGVAILAGLAVGIGAVVGLELKDRRVRSPDDLLGLEGVPVLGVLRPAGSKAPVFRSLTGGSGGGGVSPSNRRALQIGVS
jgi:chain length determinant protein EpsF